MCLLCGQNLSKRMRNRDKLIQQSIFVNGMPSGIPPGRHLLITIIQKLCVECHNTEDGPTDQIKGKEGKYCFDQLWSSRKLFCCTISLPYKTQLPFCFPARLQTIFFFFVTLYFIKRNNNLADMKYPIGC